MHPNRPIPGEFLHYKRSGGKYYFWYGDFSIDYGQEGTVYKYCLQYTTGEIGQNCGFEPLYAKNYCEILEEYNIFKKQYPDPQPPVRKIRLLCDLSDLLGGVSSQGLQNICHYLWRVANNATMTYGLGYFPKRYPYKELTLINNAFFIDLEVTNRKMMLDIFKSNVSPGIYDSSKLTARYIKNKHEGPLF